MINGLATILPAFARIALGAAAAGAMVLPGLPARANPVPAGVVIESTAEATCDETGITRSVTSNTVQVRVAELLGVAAVTLESGPVAVRSGPHALSFRVSNTGNGPEAITLEFVTAVAGNGFDAAFDNIAVDSNDNGVYDPGIDAVLPNPGAVVSLAGGGSHTLFVLLVVPAGFSDGAQSAVNVIARTATGTGTPGTVFAAAGESGTDAVVGPGGGMATATGQMVGGTGTVALVKSASVADPFGGGHRDPRCDDHLRNTGLRQWFCPG